MSFGGRELLLVVGVLLVAVLTAGGMAVRSVSRIWLRHWAERRLRGSDAALDFLEHPHRLLAASSAVVSLVVVLLGIVIATREHADAWRFALALLVVATALVLLGQIAARAVARRWASVVAAATLPFLRVAQAVAWPVLALSRAVARPIERRRLGAVEVQRDSLQELLREGELEGVGERAEIAIITGVVAFGEKPVRQVMTARDRIFALDAATPPRDLARAVTAAGYTRVPIFRGALDDVVGMVHAFDVLKAESGTLPPVRPVAFTDPDTRCNELLFRMLRARRHLAVVRTAEGRVVGIVTLEDVLEELVGEIRDEHDDPEEPEAGPGVLRHAGTIPVITPPGT